MGVRNRARTGALGLGIRSFRTNSYTTGESSSNSNNSSSTKKATGVPRKSKEVEFDMFKVCALVLHSACLLVMGGVIVYVDLRGVVISVEASWSGACHITIKSQTFS